VRIDRDAIDKLEWIAANPDSQYKWIKLIDGDPRDGASMLNSFRVVMFCALRNRQVFYEPLSGHDAILRVLQRDAVLESLSLKTRNHVSIAFHMFPSAYDAPEGRLSLPKSGERPVAVHAVRIAGWEDSGETVYFANSWGTGWGDKGYGRMSRAYVDRYLQDAWTRQSIRYGPNAHTMRAFAGAKTRSDQRAALSMEIGRRRFRIGPFTLVRYEALSVETGVRSETIEVRSAAGLRLGWAMVRHGQDDISRVHDLFVWPSFRRRGIGSYIDKVLVASARFNGANELRVSLNACDALGTNPPVGIAFGSTLGYSWTWRSSTLPNLVAIGSKAI
jgi:GNAT superfamily N-acetyltransferase